MQQYRRASREVLEEAGRLRDAGRTPAEIAVIQGSTTGEVNRRLARLAATPEQTKCALPECSVLFWPMRAGQLCCSRKHLKRWQMRRSAKIVAGYQECELPGCSKRVFRAGIRGRFCTRAHADTFRRWVDSGLYARMFGTGSTCMACGERLVVDVHHVEHQWRRGSNKEGPTVVLCPTHHMAVHRGVAVIRAGVYVSLVEDLVSELRRKHPELAASLETGRTWADKA